MQIRHNPPAWATVQSISESYRINITILLRLTWRVNFKNHNRIQDIPNMNRVVTTPYCKTMTPLIVRTHQALQNQSKKKKNSKNNKKNSENANKKKIRFLYLQKTNIQNPIAKLGQQMQQVQIHTNPRLNLGTQNQFNHQSKQFHSPFTKDSKLKTKLRGNSSFSTISE